MIIHRPDYFDYHKYDIVANANIPRSQYDLSIKYEPEWICEKDGTLRPYAYFDRDSFELETTKVADISETGSVDSKVILTLTHPLCDRIVKFTININWHLVNNIEWTEGSKLLAYPTIETLCEYEDMKDIKLKLVGPGCIELLESDPAEWKDYTYILTKSISLSSDEYEVSVSGIKDPDRITFDKDNLKLHVLHGANIENQIITLSATNVYNSNIAHKVISIKGF